MSSVVPATSVSFSPEQVLLLRLRACYPYLVRGLVLVLLAAVFYRTTNAPLSALDTWSHWKYGELIWESGRLPEREPFSPYADPRHALVDSWWLSQVLCYLVYTRAGMEGIALLYGLVEVAKTALFLAAFRRASGSLALALAGTALMLAGRWSFFGVIRPQIIGEVCWAALLLACARPPLARAAVLWVPLCVALWANLHGAFFLAFLLLGVVLVGRFLDQARRRHRFGAALADADVRRLALTLLLALAASCLNPYGVKLLIEAVNFSKYPILEQIREWQPLVPFATYESKALLLSVALTLVTVRLSPRRFAASEAMLLVLFGLSAWFAARMVPWWMSVCVYVLLPHWRAILEAWGLGAFVADDGAREAGTGLARRWPLWAGGVAAVALVLASGSGRWLLAGQPRPVTAQFNTMTPVPLTAALQEWLARGQERHEALPLRVFNSFRWGDYLVWETYPAARVYIYTHVHAFDAQRLVDQEYLKRREPPPNDWRELLERYRFNALVLQAEPGCPLLDYLRQEARPPEWEIVYDDVEDPSRWPDPQGRGVIAIRRLDPFVLTLSNAQAAQACVGGLGMTPLAGSWSILTHLPWTWAK